MDLSLTHFDHSRSSTTMRVKVALWFLPFSLGLRPKQVYWPPSSKVMFHSKMEMLLWSFFPTNSTRSLYTVTCGTTPSDGITDSHTWKDQPAVNHPKGPLKTWAWMFLSNRMLLPSVWCRCHWIASWSRGSWCRCSWSMCKATLRCCHSLPPGRESSRQTSQGPEQTTGLKRKRTRSTQPSNKQIRVFPKMLNYAFKFRIQISKWQNNTIHLPGIYCVISAHAINKLIYVSWWNNFYHLNF